MYTLQSVIKKIKKINPLIRTYLVCLLLSCERKNCAAMARSTGIKAKPLYVFLSKSKEMIEEIQEELFKLAKKTRIKGKKRGLVIDPTHIVKAYARHIEKLGYDRAGCSKRVEKCISPIYAGLSDDNMFLPISLNFWTQEKITGKKRYKSKYKLAQELVLFLINKGVEFDYVVLDGAFAVQEMLDFFHTHNIKFIMRIAKSRCITVKGKRAQLKHHSSLTLFRNSRESIVAGELLDRSYFFTAQKRKNKNKDWEVVFLISNMDMSAKEQIKIYDTRYAIEFMIRTTKQKLGAGQCQVLSTSKQQAHIMAGFLAYAIINSENNDKQKLSVDEIINFIRESHFDSFFDTIQDKSHQNNDPVESALSKHFQNFSQYYDQASYYAR
jgi:hypothetical protein